MMAVQTLSTAPRVVHHRRTWLRRRHTNLIYHLIMIAALLVTFVPILWMISTSLKDRRGFATDPAGLIPKHFTLVNYRYMLTAVDNLPIYMRNSFILAFGTAAVQVI